MLSFSIAALAVFLTYAIVCLCLFGITDSLSQTYYKWEEIHKNLGKFLFYTVLVTVGLLTIISTVEKAGIFSLLMVVGISMVGVYPDYLNKTDNTFHVIGALIAALSSGVTLFILLPAWLAATILGIVFVIVLIFALLTKTLKRAYVYHMEMVAFYSLFSGSILYNLFFV